jgi:hypothetical protein
MASPVGPAISTFMSTRTRWSMILEICLGGDQIVTEQPCFLARRLGGKAVEQCQ